MNRYARLTAAIITIVMLLVLASGCSDELSRADALAAEGDLPGAEAAYREALLDETEDLEALNGLAVLLMLQRKFDEALPIQERIVAADPEDAQTRVELGFNYLNHQERPDDAVCVFEEAAALEGTAQRFTFLAQAQREAGRRDEAERSARRAIEVDPQYRHSYTVLIGLLESDGRMDEAAEIERQMAASAPAIDSEQQAP
ncbi:MAG: tetratricopeptide repeat protein [Thermoleophilia bacterium]|nr:tetratricopeptide repeat protein [Thermoleophilia bacterium]